jgi:hypothetical protein
MPIGCGVPIFAISTRKPIDTVTPLAVWPFASKDSTRSSRRATEKEIRRFARRDHPQAPKASQIHHAHETPLPEPGNRSPSDPPWPTVVLPLSPW